MTDILDEGGLHLVRLGGPLIGLLQFFQVLAACKDDIDLCHDQQYKQEEANGEGDEAVARRFVFHVVDGQLVADAHHAVGQRDVVHGVVGVVGMAQGLVSLLPAARLFVEQGDDAFTFVAEFLPRQFYGLVGLSLRGEVIDLHRPAVNGTLAFLYTLLVGFVALEELGYVTGIIVTDGASCLDVEDAFRGVFLGYLLRLVEQGHRLLRVLVDLHIDEVHVDGRHALVVALLLHQFEDFVEIPLGGLLVAADAVDVAEHVVGHVHLLVEFLLAQFHGQLPSQHIGLEDLLLVHLEDDLIAALRVVGVKVVLLQQIVLQVLDGREEPGTVAVVEGMVHGVAQDEIFFALGIVGIGCDTEGGAECQGQ